MKILILEDEPLVADHLVEQVKKLQPDTDIAGPLSSVRETREWLQHYPLPDLILADIQLADGISLDVFGVSQPGCPVIFTTAYDEYAIRAFKINSIDYLLKPIDTDELAAAFRKYHLLREKYRNQLYRDALLTLIEKRNFEKPYKENFVVHQGKVVYLVSQVNIAFFMKEDIIFLVQDDGKSWVSEFRSLDEIEELVNPQQFFRANRQFLVQRCYISGYKTSYTGKLTLEMKMQKPSAIIISKEKAPAFRNWLEQ